MKKHFQASIATSLLGLLISVPCVRAGYADVPPGGSHTFADAGLDPDGLLNAEVGNFGGRTEVLRANNVSSPSDPNYAAPGNFSYADWYEGSYADFPRLQGQPYLRLADLDGMEVDYQFVQGDWGGGNRLTLTLCDGANTALMDVYPDIGGARLPSAPGNWHSTGNLLASAHVFFQVDGGPLLTSGEVQTQYGTLRVMDIQMAIDNASTDMYVDRLTLGFAAPGSRTIIVADVQGVPDAPVDVPVQLEALGGENAVAFSVSFDATVLTSPTVTLGTDVEGQPGAILLLNDRQAAVGKLGIGVGLQSGSSLPAGLREIVVLHFQVLPGARQMVALTLGDSPTLREVADLDGAPLPANYASGSVEISNHPPVAVEDAYSTAEDAVLTVAAPGVLGNDTDADSDPLQVTEVNGVAADVGTQLTLASGATLRVNGDGSLVYDPNHAFDSLALGETRADSFTYKIADGHEGSDSAVVSFTIEGREYESDVITDSFGDNEVDVFNVVKVGRYVIGLDPVPSPSALFRRVDAARRATSGDGRITIGDWVQALIKLKPAEAGSGEFGCVIELQSREPVAAASFSLRFDPTRLQFKELLPAAVAGGTPALYLNESALAEGRLGVLLASSLGSAYPEGKFELARCIFQVLGDVRGKPQVALTSRPVNAKVASLEAAPLAAIYVPGEGSNSSSYLDWLSSRLALSPWTWTRRIRRGVSWRIWTLTDIPTCSSSCWAAILVRRTAVCSL